jgi:hypothetical protein
MSDQITQLVKNQISTLSYVEKMELKVWLEEQIDKDRGVYVEEKKKNLDTQIDNLVNKSSEILNSGTKTLKHAFNQAFGGQNTQTPDNTQK